MIQGVSVVRNLLAADYHQGMKNILRQNAEKILLINPLNFRGGLPAPETKVVTRGESPGGMGYSRTVQLDDAGQRD